MELNIFVSKQDLINGTRTTAHSAINHALFMINIPADQLSGEVWTGVVFWSKLNTRRIGSSALNMGYMLPKFHGHIQVVDLPRISTLPLHGTSATYNPMFKADDTMRLVFNFDQNTTPVQSPPSGWSAGMFVISRT